MRFDEYEKAADAFRHYPRSDEQSNIIYPSLALAGEAGELTNEVKKYIRDDDCELTATRRAKIIDEAGDVLWYLQALAMELGTSLAAIAGRNLEKLTERAKKGKACAPTSG